MLSGWERICGSGGEDEGGLGGREAIIVDTPAAQDCRRGQERTTLRSDCRGGSDFVGGEQGRAGTWGRPRCGGKGVKGSQRGGGVKREEGGERGQIEALWQYLLRDWRMQRVFSISCIAGGKANLLVLQSMARLRLAVVLVLLL
eukprot:403219-Rhodomonas_salina.1